MSDARNKGRVRRMRRWLRTQHHLRTTPPESWPTLGDVYQRYCFDCDTTITYRQACWALVKEQVRVLFWERGWEARVAMTLIPGAVLP